MYCAPALQQFAKYVYAPIWIRIWNYCCCEMP